MNMNLQGYSGLMMVTGAEGDPPTAISNSWNDYIGGLHGAFAVLQALEKRIATGNGAHIDLSQFECSAAMVGPLLLGSAVSGTTPLRRGNRSALAAPQGVYRCAGIDEWCAISVGTDEQWSALTKAMMQPEWGSESRFATTAGRMKHHDDIDRGIEAWTASLGSREVEIRLKQAGVSAGRVRRIDDVIGTEETATVFENMEEPRVGTMLTTRLPFSFASSNLLPPRSAPRLGENTAEVLHEWLSLSNGEIEELKRTEALL
jgi:crotonobetainyl-CoA:carnitine CoA-transferase CaiB-like acyl-CoA transferase